MWACNLKKNTGVKTTEWITSNFWSKVNMWFNNLMVVIFMCLLHMYIAAYAMVPYLRKWKEVFLNLRNHLTVCAFDLRNINHLNLLQIHNNKIALSPKHFIHLSLNKIFWQLSDLYLTKLRWKFTGHDWSKWIFSNAETKLAFDKCPANSQLLTDLLHDRKFSGSQFCSVGTRLMLVITPLLCSWSIPCYPLDTLKRCWGGM